jgi:CHAT domain-containing protein
LVRRSTEYRRAKEEVTIEGLRARLPDGFALVDFLEYAHYIPPKKGQAGGWRYERQLVAFVVTAGGLTGPIDLGPVAPVSEAIDTWRVSFGMSPQGQAAGQVLRERVWEPVERALVERNSFRSGDGSTSGMNSALRTVLISPDGVLGRLPLGGLPGREPGKYLLEEWTLGVLPVPAMLPELLDASSRRQVDKNVLLLGDVDYDAQADAAEQAAQPTPRTFGARLAQRAVRWQDQRFDALKATGGEIASIGRMYRLNFGQEGISILEQAGATEAAFRREAPQHKYLHLATHGFFAPPGLASALSGSADPLRMMRMSGDGPGDMLGWGADVKGYHPGLLSGLALAGANRSVGMAADGDPDRGGIPDRRGSPTLPDRRGSPTPSAQPPGAPFPLPRETEGDDGLLTAEEVATLNLGGVELAVLSACETGLGEVAGGEGLLGLQRSFQVAGARTVVASLWRVHDEATRGLMERFYDNLWNREMSAVEALREAQLWMLREGRERGLVRLDDDQPADPQRVSPYYWAAFVLSGDWR